MRYLNEAHRLAPTPAEHNRDDRMTWAIHYAAQALAAHADFRDAITTDPPRPDTGVGSRPELGYQAVLAGAAAAAAVALSTDPHDAGAVLWSLTPEAGSLNGEVIDWLAEFLYDNDINPAHLYPWFDRDDFSPGHP